MIHHFTRIYEDNDDDDDNNNDNNPPHSHKSQFIEALSCCAFASKEREKKKEIWKFYGRDSFPYILHNEWEAEKIVKICKLTMNKILSKVFSSA